VLFESYKFIAPLAANLQREGFRRPTDIQFRAIRPTLNGADLLAIAQTGTGKTMAFAIPIIDILGRSTHKRTEHAPRALILVPTHELARQIAEVFKKLARSTQLKVLCVTGGGDIDELVRSIPRYCDIVVATPGRILDLVRNKHLSLHYLQILVLDEADRMLSLGFRPDIDSLIGHMPQRRQTLFYSATISPEIKKLAHRLVRNPIRIEIAPEDPITQNVDHALLEVPMEEKRFFLERIIRENPESKIIVFVRTKVRAERVQTAMRRVNIETSIIHGGLERIERLWALNSFSEGSVRVLIATDVSARGLDIPNINYVINYDMPTEPEVYVHRIGRTGRGNKHGVAVSFCAPEEEPLRRAIESLIGRYLPIIEMDRVAHDETLALSAAADTDWRTLLRREQEREAEILAAGKKKKRKI
jgi:DEAD/DEAH box helicase domain protein